MLEAAIEAGAEDVVSSDSGHEVYTDAGFACAKWPRRWRRSSASRARRRWSGSRRTRSPSTTRRASRLLELVETLNENDDVQNVYANFEVSDAVVAKMSA